MRINWSDPSKNTAAELEEYRKFIQATTPGVRYSDVYGPTADQDDDTANTWAVSGRKNDSTVTHSWR